MPAQNTFSGTGILDGQIVEAPHVSQSVDAFTAQKDYDVVLSGSLEVTGSVLISGSLINEYTGQFKTLGIGTTAPISPTMLHIKSDAAGGFDPIVLIEAKTGNDLARLRLKNLDVEYDMGAFGSSGDSFMIVQEQSGTPKFPFIIDKDTTSYTLYSSGNSVGVGLGASSPIILSALPAGSIQVDQLVSGSTLIGQTISASAAGENIHGTASYATFIDTAQTASYVKSTSIDFHYSISQQINSVGTIAATTGSFNHLKVDDDSGIALKNISNANYTRFISGSTETNQGVLWIGNMSLGGTMLEINNINDHIKFHASKTYMTGDAVVGDDLFISGSVTPSLVIGPNAAPGTVNVPSSSLFANSLEFNRNNNAYVGNYNTSTTSKLQLSAGGGGTNSLMAIELSASRDVKFSGSLNIIQRTPSDEFDIVAYWNLGQTAFGAYNGSGRSAYYKMKALNTSSTGNATVFRFGSLNNASNWYLTDQRICTHVKLCIIGSPNDGEGVYVEREYLFSYNGNNWAMESEGTLIRKNSNSVYNSTSITFGTSLNVPAGTANFSLVLIKGTSTSTTWAGWCEVKRIGIDATP